MKRKAITLTLEPEEKEKLEKIAISMECYWGGKANISRLIKEIALGEILVRKPKTKLSDTDKSIALEQIKLIKIASNKLLKIIES
jgi:hypothetical protein